MNQLLEAGQTTRTEIAGTAGTIEAAISTPLIASDTPVVAVICHPHPLYGGTMDNKVVTTLARCCVDTGMIALRFNFRGVGASKGAFDGGDGESEDALAVLDWGLRETGAYHLVVAGFSFGGYVALQVAQRRRTIQLVTVAPALNYSGMAPWQSPGCPWLLIHGDADDVVNCRETVDRVKAILPVPQVHVLAGVGHFFHGRLGDLRKLILPVLQQRIAELSTAG